VKVSSKNQIAVPAEVRRELKIKPGDTLLGTVGGRAVLMPQPADYAAALRVSLPRSGRLKAAQEHV